MPWRSVCHAGDQQSLSPEIAAMMRANSATKKRRHRWKVSARTTELSWGKMSTAAAAAGKLYGTMPGAFY
jgi:hypothetical protein